MAKRKEAGSVTRISWMDLGKHPADKRMWARHAAAAGILSRLHAWISIAQRVAKASTRKQRSSAAHFLRTRACAPPAASSLALSHLRASIIAQHVV